MYVCAACTGLIWLCCRLRRAGPRLTAEHSVHITVPLVQHGAPQCQLNAAVGPKHRAPAGRLRCTHSVCSREGVRQVYQHTPWHVQAQQSQYAPPPRPPRGRCSTAGSPTSGHHDPARHVQRSPAGPRPRRYAWCQGTGNQRGANEPGASLVPSSQIPTSTPQSRRRRAVQMNVGEKHTIAQLTLLHPRTIPAPHIQPQCSSARSLYTTEAWQASTWGCQSATELVYSTVA